MRADTFAVMGSAFGRLETTYGWLLDVDTASITVADKDPAAADIEQAQQWINSAEPGFRLSTSLLAVFSGYDERLLFTKVPMLVFLVTAAIVVLYYVATMASLTIDRRRTDVVLLPGPRRGLARRPCGLPHRRSGNRGARGSPWGPSWQRSR